MRLSLYNSTVNTHQNDVSNAHTHTHTHIYKHTHIHKVQMDWRLGRVFPHSCHSALICIVIPVYTALSSSCLCLQPPVPRRLCLLSPCPCLDLPPVTLSHRGDRPVCPFKLQTLSQCVREKGGSDRARQGTRGGLSD